METSCKQTQNIQNKIIRELDKAPDVAIRFWSTFELDILKKYYGKKDTRVIAKVINRPLSHVCRKASYLGLTFKR